MPLTGLAAAEARIATRGVAAVHAAIARRAFRATGPLGRPVRGVHDAIASAAYVAAEEIAAVGAAGAAAAARRHPGPAATALGLLGDGLERDGNPLHEPLAVRVDGRAVPAEPAALAAAFPDATGFLAILVHGLMGTERVWLPRGRPGHGERLAQALGATPVLVRHNSGRSLDRNGADLAALIETVAAAWPVPVERIALVGHSMGGLIVRSATHHGRRGALAWPDRVSHVVCLGSPHLGAAPEQLVGLAASALALAPETRPFARGLRRRSEGIRDLRRGLPDLPLLPGATHCFVAATVTRSPRHPLGRLVGDGLVLAPSARGGTRIRFDAGLELGAAGHFGLLTHPAVGEQLVTWLRQEPGPPPARSSAGRRRPRARARDARSALP